jgi:hypothetical protein
MARSTNARGKSYFHTSGYHDEMEAYDNLPKEIRVLLSNAKNQYSALQVTEMIDKYGIIKVSDLLRKS